MTKLSKKQSKKMAKMLGVSPELLTKLLEDLQEMGLLKHIKDAEWRLFDGKEWQPLTI